ncbi:hypothetical protein ACLOAV_005619 [Pseudogymnoascus australis]
MSLRATISAVSVLLAMQPGVMAALNPNCAPGGNFDMKPWKLQLPIGNPGQPQTISSSQLQGCDGYEDPGKHCRTELREANPSDGSAASWSPNAAKNRLYASLSVAYADESSHGTVIGQIHIDDSISTKPVCELFYNSKGDISMGVEQTRAGNNLLFTPIGNIPVGQQFSYEIRYESNVLSVGINGGSQKVLDTYELNAPNSYFKVGNYNQGNNPSDVHFLAIIITH